jgi:quercetin dioxygenase-like cupin family protein
MKNYKLNAMTKGWFVGSFSPTAYTSNECEVAVKQYSAGDYEAAHVHKIATEITLIIKGKVHMAGREWGEGDIIVIEPGEATDFKALTDAINVVVKLPSLTDDKYLV